MTDIYRGNTALPGATADQAATVEHLLALVPDGTGYKHDNLMILLNNALGTGGPYDTSTILAALYVVLRDNGGVFISPTLFPVHVGVAAKAAQVLAAKAGLGGSANVKA
jgi:hypothetical protein